MSIRERLLQLLKDKKEPMQLQVIYREYENNYGVTDYQKENDNRYPSPRIRHEIRSILTKLAKQKKLEKPKRGFYQIK